MKNKFIGMLTLLVTAMVSGYMLFSILKKAGFPEAFDFDLFENIDEETF